MALSLKENRQWEETERKRSGKWVPNRLLEEVQAAEAAAEVEARAAAVEAKCITCAVAKPMAGGLSMTRVKGRQLKIGLACRISCEHYLLRLNS
jgi:hypothetical protein